VCTPEKYDVITRNPAAQALLHRVRLLIIDEVHMLHEERGPVLKKKKMKKGPWGNYSQG
jgi:replicative superfamily II helicase